MSAQHLSGGLITSVGRVGVWLVPVLLGITGCAQSPSRSLARVWNDSPKIWSKVPEVSPQEKPAESKVAANTPTEKSKDVESKSVFDRFRSGSRQNSDGDTRKQTVAEKRTDSGPVDPFLEAERSEGRTVAKKPAPPARRDKAAEQTVVSARDRLRATLSDEPRPEVIPVVDVGSQDQLRLRIESLMNRARAHCAQEDWPAARRAAELAQSLAESSGMEFDPDVERPVELLTLINGRLAEEAESAMAELADNEPSTETPVETTEGEQASTKGAEPSAEAGPKKPRFPFAGDVPFDPYSHQVALADLHEDGADQAFGPSMVMLESPSFEDGPEVSPIAFSRSTVRMRNRARLAPPPADDPVSPIAEETPGPPLAMETTDERIALPECLDGDESVAPPPPLTELDGPTLQPMSQQLADKHSTMPSDLEPASDDTDEETEREELRPASAWPRWMPLSLASLLTAGFCCWLWRRQRAVAG